MDIEQARKIVDAEFHQTSGFSKDDPSLCKAKGFIQGWQARGQADCQILNDYPDITVDDLARLKEEIFCLDDKPGDKNG